MKTWKARLAWLALGAALGPSCTPPDDALTGQVEQGISVCVPATTLEGVDVYDGTGTINWTMAYGGGIRFAMVKATQGTGNTQTTFATNRHNAEAAGVYVSSYHFFDPTQDGVAQAHHFLSVVGTLGAMDLPAMLDLECPDGDSACLGYAGGSGAGVGAATIRSRMLDWLTTVETATGRTPIIYTFGSYLSSNGINTTGLAHYPLFIADPTTTAHCSTASGTCFSVPSPWTTAPMWQWTWHGCVPGISGECDRDKFLGTMADLMTFATGHAPDWGAQYVSQSFPLSADGALSIPAGGTASVSLTMKNIGAHAWDASTCLGTTVPRDRVDALAGPEWHAPNRPACVAAGMTVAPGANYTFTWTLHAPATTGMIDEHWGMLEEGAQWFSDPGEAGPPDDDLEGIFRITAGDGGVGTTDGGDDAAAGDGATSDGATSDAGVPTDAASAHDAASSDGGSGSMDHGCGCSAPGGTREGSRGALIASACAAMVLAGARRRRR